MINILTDGNMIGSLSNLHNQEGDNMKSSA